MSGRKIVTEQRRELEWLAYRDEYDLGEPIGNGKTELDAIQELIELEELDE